MRHYRSLGFSSLLALAIAAPAHAQMTPEGVWTLLENYMKQSGAEVAVGENRRDGDRMVVRNVTLTTKQPDIGSSIVTIPEVTLRDMGDGKVEVVTSPDSVIATTVDGEEGEKIATEVKVTYADNRTIVSGTPEKPVFDMSASRFEMVQATSVDGEAAPFDATIVGTDLSGVVKLDLAAAPQQADYSINMGKLSVVSQGEIAGEEGQEDSSFDANFSMEAIKVTYLGTLPEAVPTSADSLPSLEGKVTFATGPTTVHVKSGGAQPMDATFTSTSSNLGLDMAKLGATFSLIHTGLDVFTGAAKAASASATDLSAKGEMIVPPSDTNPNGNLEAAYGKVKLELTSLTPLLNRAVEAKLASQEDMMGIQLMLSFFTQPGATEDSITLELEQTQDGKTLINGEEMP